MRASLLPVIFLSGCCVFSVAPYRGPKSDHFNGARFHNPDVDFPERGPLDIVRLIGEVGASTWPAHVAVAPQPAPPARVGRGEMRVTFVNHATVLIQMDGVNVLTDPIWSERPSPISFIGPRRVHAPGVAFADLPEIDLVLISHSHYDHLDLPTLDALWRRDQPRFVVGLGAGPILRGAGIPKVRELDWWRGFTDPAGLRVMSVPVQHFGNRGLCDRGGQLWTGYVVEGPAAGRVYFSGDTGFGPHFAAAQEKFGDFRLAVLPIGAYQPQWFMEHVHMDPAGAVKAHQALRAQTSVGIHFGTFDLAFEGREDPITDLAAARKLANLPPEAFWALAPGEGRDVPPMARSDDAGAVVKPSARAPSWSTAPAHPPLAACSVLGSPPTGSGL